MSRTGERVCRKHMLLNFTPEQANQIDVLAKESHRTMNQLLVHYVLTMLEQEWADRARDKRDLDV